MSLSRVFVVQEERLRSGEIPDSSRKPACACGLAWIYSCPPEARTPVRIRPGALDSVTLTASTTDLVEVGAAQHEEWQIAASLAFVLGHTIFWQVRHEDD